MKFIPDYIEIGDRQHALAQIIADNAFALAMAAAIASRQETAVPGVHVDHRPLLTTLWRGYAVSSGCGSPAAMCVDQGEG
jgi:hypothetical protein